MTLAELQQDVAALQSERRELSTECTRLAGESADLRRDRDWALRECDRLKAELESALNQEMVGVTLEMSAAAFVSRDLVEQARQALGDQSTVMEDAIARGQLLLSEALGVPHEARDFSRDHARREQARQWRAELTALRGAVKKVHAWRETGALVEFDATEQAAWNEAVGR